MSDKPSNRFDFVKDELLRKNLNEIFIDIIHLLDLSEKHPDPIQTNLRRAVLMYTASIIEALVHYIVAKGVSPLEYEEEEWKFDGNPHVCHEFEDENGRKAQIVCGKRFKKHIAITRSTQFKPILKVASDHNLISSALCERVDQVRQLRNRIHLAGLQELEKKYPQEMLEEVFGVAREITVVAEELSNY